MVMLKDMKQKKNTKTTISCFFSHLFVHIHTLRCLRYFQACCLGDHSLFRCVVKETKMEGRGVGGGCLLKFLESPSAVLEQGKSNTGA